MAKQTLPVDFKDDVLNVSMDGKRRYRLLLQEDGTYVLEDVTDYDTVGSTFGAAQINQTNQAVNQSADKGDVLGTLSQVKSNSDAKKIASANSLKELAVASNLKTYTTLAQLSLSAPTTVEQIFSAMPDNSYVQIDANNSNVVTNMPTNSSGLLEISKIAGGRNFARFTQSISTNAANKAMWYGVFSWSGSVAFGGWKKILERDEILATDEEIEANTDPNKIASAVAVKRLNSEIEALNDEGAIKGLEVREGDGVYITYQDGADTVSKKLGSKNFQLGVSCYSSSDTSGSFSQYSYSEIDVSDYSKLRIITGTGLNVTVDNTPAQKEGDYYLLNGNSLSFVIQTRPMGAKVEFELLV